MSLQDSPENAADRMGEAVRGWSQVTDRELQLERSKMTALLANAQFRDSGAPGARTQNPRIKSPLLYH